MSEQAGRYVLLISEEMEERCFPGELKAELDRIYPWTTIRSTQSLTDDEWRGVLRTCEVVCSSWGMRPLPDTDDPSELPEYVCYIAGAVSCFANQAHFKAGVRVTNWGDSIAETIAESALMGILACLRRVGYRQHLTHELKGWREDTESLSATLFDKRVGLIGLGLIAREMIPLLAPFRSPVYACDPYVANDIFEGLNVVRVDSLADLFDTCPISFLKPSKSIVLISIGSLRLSIRRFESTSCRANEGAIEEARRRYSRLWRRVSKANPFFSSSAAQVAVFSTVRSRSSGDPANLTYSPTAAECLAWSAG